MDQIIGTMVKLDEDARKIVENAEDYKAETHQKLVEKKEALAKRYEEEQAAAIQEIREKHQKALEEKEAVAEKETQEKIKRLEAFFKEKEKAFIDEIYQHCLDGEQE